MLTGKPLFIYSALDFLNIREHIYLMNTKSPEMVRYEEACDAWSSIDGAIQRSSARSQMALKARREECRLELVAARDAVIANGEKTL